MGFKVMQFSVAPWRVLDAGHLNAVHQAVQTRAKLTPLIFDLARESGVTGTPIISPLEYVFPNQGFEGVLDPFMLGDAILVAPMDHPPTRPASGPMARR